MKGWFKPCGLSDEYPENEVVASAFDFVSGFHRSPPALMRNITVEELRHIAEKNSFFSPWDKKLAILEQTCQICSSNGIFHGAVIGWYKKIFSYSKIFFFIFIFIFIFNLFTIIF
jgi:hypothetical protein